MTVNLTGTLPKSDESNGLCDLAAKLVGESKALHVAVVVLEVSKVTTNCDTGDVTPTVRVRRVEPITDDEDMGWLGRIATRAFERRTGQTVLPLDMEDEIRAAFGDTTDDTGSQ